MKKSSIGISVMFSCYIAVIPIIEYYKSPLRGFNCATFFAMVFLALFAVLIGMRIAREGKVVLDGRMMPVWGYIVFMTLNVIVCFSLYNYDYTWSNLSSYVRFIVLFFSI